MQDEVELIQRCRIGDRQAQRQLFEQTSPRIYGLLLRMTGNADDAFDLTQETYIKGFNRIGEFDHRSSVVTWLHRIAVNEALQLQRRGRMSNGKQREIAAARPPQHDGNGRLTMRLDLESAMQSLTPNERVILLLRYQEGCDYRTIAKILAVPEGTVASRLGRARDQLRGLLKKGYGPLEEEPQAVHRNNRRAVMAQEDGLPACGEILD